MSEAAKIARLMLESATTLTQSLEARALMVAIDALPPNEALPAQTVLVTRCEDDQRRVDALPEKPQAVVCVPNVNLDRMGQVKLAAIIALSTGAVELGDRLVFLSGPFRGLVDTVCVIALDEEYELFDGADRPSLDEHVRRAVFHRVLGIALDLGHHGREGKSVGALFVVGDAENVLEQSEQMILNPFKGYDESERNVLDEMMRETVREYSTLDGAFIIRGNGVVVTAGTRLKAGLSEGLPSGLGARHAAAAGISANTRAIAISVSQSDGTVRVWRGGRMVASFDRSV